jgi:aminopeptidase N
VRTDLVFDINDGVTEVTSTLEIERQNSQGSQLHLDGQELELVSVELDGRLLSSNEYQLQGEQLILRELADRHQVRIVTRIHPEQNTALEGLYRSSKMYCTQCEAQGFRKITYYQDRPDVLSKFTTTIVADGERYPNLLSNGNLIAEEQLQDGRKKGDMGRPLRQTLLFVCFGGRGSRCFGRSFYHHERARGKATDFFRAT